MPAKIKSTPVIPPTLFFLRTSGPAVRLVRVVRGALRGTAVREHGVGLRRHDVQLPGGVVDFLFDTQSMV